MWRGCANGDDRAKRRSFGRAGCQLTALRLVRRPVAAAAQVADQDCAAAGQACGRIGAGSQDLRQRARRPGRARSKAVLRPSCVSVRAATGHDIVTFPFSSTALRIMAMRPDMAEDRAIKLAGVRSCRRIGLSASPLHGPVLLQANLLRDDAPPAPRACWQSTAIVRRRCAKPGTDCCRTGWFRSEIWH